MRARLEQTWTRIKRRTERPSLQTAIGLAAPALEAWLCCGDGKTTEANWIRDLHAGARSPARIRELKRAVYGSHRPSLALAREVAVREAARIASGVPALEKDFPVGFGCLATQLRAWKQQDS
jgi:hypothetical protein